jgi:hypothetical protein
MDAVIQKIISEDLTGSEMTEMLSGRATVKLYDSVAKASSISDLCGPYGRIALLFPVQTNTNGHWLGIWVDEATKLIHHFDSYGLDPSAELHYTNNAEVTGMPLTEFYQKCISQGYQVVYNTVPYQDLTSGVNTCGRHVIVRLRLSYMDENAYKGLMSKQKLNPDQMVTMMTFLALDETASDKSVFTSGGSFEGGMLSLTGPPPPPPSRGQQQQQQQQQAIGQVTIPTSNPIVNKSPSIIMSTQEQLHNLSEQSTGSEASDEEMLANYITPRLWQSVYASAKTAISSKLASDLQSNAADILLPKYNFIPSSLWTKLPAVYSGPPNNFNPQPLSPSTIAQCQQLVDPSVKAYNDTIWLMRDQQLNIMYNQQLEADIPPLYEQLAEELQGDESKIFDATYDDIPNSLWYNAPTSFRGVPLQQDELSIIQNFTDPQVAAYKKIISTMRGNVTKTPPPQDPSEGQEEGEEGNDDDPIGDLVSTGLSFIGDLF